MDSRLRLEADIRRLGSDGRNGSVFAVQRALTAARRDAAVREAGSGQLQTYGVLKNQGPKRPLLSRLLPFARQPSAPAILFS